MMESKSNGSNFMSWSIWSNWRSWWCELYHSFQVFKNKKLFVYTGILFILYDPVGRTTGLRSHRLRGPNTVKAVSLPDLPIFIFVKKWSIFFVKPVIDFNNGQVVGSNNSISYVFRILYRNTFFKHQNQLRPMSVLSSTGCANSGYSWFDFS